MSIGHLSLFIARAGVLLAWSKHAHTHIDRDTYIKAIYTVWWCRGALLVIQSTENEHTPGGQELCCSDTNPTGSSPARNGVVVNVT